MKSQPPFEEKLEGTCSGQCGHVAWHDVKHLIAPEIAPRHISLLSRKSPDEVRRVDAQQEQYHVPSSWFTPTMIRFRSWPDAQTTNAVAPRSSTCMPRAAFLYPVLFEQRYSLAEF